MVSGETKNSISSLELKKEGCSEKKLFVKEAEKNIQEEVEKLSPLWKRI